MTLNHTKQFMRVWAKKWNVSNEALTELEIQGNVRLLAADAGSILWRNNVGATYTKNGGFIRYGLCNETAQENQRIKSSDLIGIKPVEIGGKLIGQFVAREVKRNGWKYSGTSREVAQLRFLEIVKSYGGDGAFTTGGFDSE